MRILILSILPGGIYSYHYELQLNLRTERPMLQASNGWMYSTIKVF